MQKKIVYWKTYNQSETGYTLVEIYEDGTLLKRRFEKNQKDPFTYKELSSTPCDSKGEIVLEQITFDEASKVSKHHLPENLKRLETYALKDWKDARKKIRSLQKEALDNLSIDYHTVLKLDQESICDDIRDELDRFEFPIVKYRVVSDGDYLKRKKYPEQLSIEFFPSLNEKLYFHHIPENKHLNMSGDNLFALDTTYTEGIEDEEHFWTYIHEMLNKVSVNLKHYQTLITKQRERRAMLETDVLGDLYPR
jgi:hypothetical protein